MARTAEAVVRWRINACHDVAANLTSAATMNYRHHFHAGNFADVMKHAFLVRLLSAMQRKEKGFLFLDTHAGRGSYDLTAAAKGDSLVRRPEHPDGIGRLLARTDAPELFARYLDLVKRFDRDRGNPTGPLRFYPGSPWLAQMMARVQDRIVLCEQQPEEAELLGYEFGRSSRVQVRAVDGYGTPRAVLPPVERRALILIDPPFESREEFQRIASAVRDALTRLAGAVIAIWYPLTERARVDAFFAELLAVKLPPTLELELMVAGEQSLLKMKGCGLVIINPPWQFEDEARPMLVWLESALAQESGGVGRLRWLVSE